MTVASLRATWGILALALAAGLCGCQTDRDGVSVNVSKALELYREHVNPKPTRAQMERVIALLPAEQLTDMGVLYERENRLDDAAQAYQRAIWRDLYYTRAYVNLGNVLRQQGKLDAARFRYRQALVTDPNSVAAANNFADVCATDGKDTAEAIRRLEPLSAKAGPLRPYTLDTLGWLYHRQGRNERARQLLISALTEVGTKNDALRAIVQEHLAAVNKELGLSAQAAPHERAAGP